MDIVSIKEMFKSFSINNDYIAAYENYYDSNNNENDNEIINKFIKLQSIERLYKYNKVSEFRNFYVATAGDVEVLIVQIIHYYNYLKLNKFSQEESVVHKVKFIGDVFVPICARLGLYSLKSEMEDLVFFVLDNEAYKNIAKLLNVKKKDRDKTINSMIENIEKIIGNNYDIYGRSKHIYSIYKKINSKGKDFQALFDLFAIRIIVPTIDDCYSVLGELNDSFEPVKNRFKDYIAKPKNNGYQSIHTVIKGEGNKLFEIQIRTEQMHANAELGVAAHFSYKEKVKAARLDVALLNYRNSKEYIPTNDIYAITPLDKLVHLKNGDTVIDYAFAIHTQVGVQMVGALVNGKIKPLNYKVKNLDVIKILTKKNSNKVNIEWVEMSNSQSTKRKIKSFVKKKELAVSELALKEGYKILSKDLVKNGISSRVLSDSKVVNRIIREFNYKHINLLYCDIYEKKIKTSEIISKLNVQEENSKDIKLSNIINNTFKDDVEVFGAYGIKTDIAKCCYPIFGDEIVAAVKQGDSFKIHKKGCKQVSSKHVIGARWNIMKKGDTKYLCSVRLITEEQTTSNLLSMFSKDKIEIVKLTTKDLGDYKVMNMNIYLKTLEQFNDIRANITKDKNVVSFERI